MVRQGHGHIVHKKGEGQHKGHSLAPGKGLVFRSDQELPEEDELVNAFIKAEDAFKEGCLDALVGLHEGGLFATPDPENTKRKARAASYDTEDPVDMIYLKHKGREIHAAIGEDAHDARGKVIRFLAKSKRANSKERGR